MNVNDVYEQIAEQLRTLPGLAAIFDYPPGKVTPPAGILSYPDEITYNVEYGPTGARIPSLPLVLVAGKVIERTSRITAAGWASTSGPSSVKAVLEAGDYTAFDDLTVTGGSFDTAVIGGVDYLAVTFDLDIIGH